MYFKKYIAAKARFILWYLFRYLVSNRDFFQNLVSIWSLFLSKVSILIKCLRIRFLHVCTAAASLSRLVTWSYIHSSDGCHCQSMEQRCTETKLPPPNPCGVQLFAQVQVNFNEDSPPLPPIFPAIFGLWLSWSLYWSLLVSKWSLFPRKSGL